MNVPFTSEQFFNVFAQYNTALWWAAAALWIGAGLAVNAAWHDPSARSRRLTWFLAALWLWNALAYHVAFFAPVNPAAWVFASAFTLQALLFVFLPARRDLDYFTARGWRRGTGTVLIVYAFVYPILNVAVGHEYPGTPTFGVPCPTAILTLGLLLTVRARSARALSIIPALWGFVAGWAALLFNVWADYVLVLAALVTTLDMLGRLARRARHRPAPHAQPPSAPHLRTDGLQ